MPAALARYLEHLGVRGYRPQGMATAARYIRDFIADRTIKQVRVASDRRS